MKTVRGRYAPSPTGYIHVGNARTALAAWLSVRSQGGSFVWRLEDIDIPRVVDGMADAAMEDLAWLGLDWEEGPDTGGPFGPYEQSKRRDTYEAALQDLYRKGRLFPCRRSRKDLLQLASAPHEEESNPYPRSFRPASLDPDWFLQPAHAGQETYAIRFLVDDTPVRFVDRVLGEQTEQVDRAVGDFVLKRRDGLFAYQLAVVVDDLAMGITEVVRGADLLSSTARQIQLIQALGGDVPVYGHIPLVVNHRGEKLSKRDQGLTLRSLRGQGIQPEQVLGYLGFTLGLKSDPSAASLDELVTRWSWDRITREPWSLPVDLAEYLNRVK